MWPLPTWDQTQAIRLGSEHLYLLHELSCQPLKFYLILNWLYRVEVGKSKKHIYLFIYQILVVGSLLLDAGITTEDRSRPLSSSNLQPNDGPNSIHINKVTECQRTDCHRDNMKIERFILVVGVQAYLARTTTKDRFKKQIFRALGRGLEVKALRNRIMARIQIPRKHVIVVVCPQLEGRQRIPEQAG